MQNLRRPCDPYVLFPTEASTYRWVDSVSQTPRVSHNTCSRPQVAHCVEQTQPTKMLRSLSNLIATCTPLSLQQRHYCWRQRDSCRPLKQDSSKFQRKLQQASYVSDDDSAILEKHSRPCRLLLGCWVSK